MGHTGKEQNMSTNAVFAGIDVSKAHLDVAVRPDAIEWRGSVRTQCRGRIASFLILGDFTIVFGDHDARGNPINNMPRD
jgi:hypothetical protein